MGIFSRLIHKESNLIFDIYDVNAFLSAHGYIVEVIDDADAGGVIFNRIRITKGGFHVIALWDGNILTFAQKHHISKDLHIGGYQKFHINYNYFVLNYGLPEGTLVIRHDVYMGRQSPVIASSIKRILLLLENDIDIKKLINQLEFNG